MHLNRLNRHVRLKMYTKTFHQSAAGLMKTPRSTKKVFRHNPDKKPALPIQKPIKASSFEVRSGPRVNSLDIQMIPTKIYKHIFSHSNAKQANPEVTEQCRRVLLKHKMVTKDDDYVPDVEFVLPPLDGSNILEHFANIGHQQVQPYKDLVGTLLVKLPKPPDKWEMQCGWMRYAPDSQPEPVPYPRERALVFDVEVCMAAGKTPTLATAVSSEAWYGWVSQALIDGTSKPVTTHQYSTQMLIPLESGNGESGAKLSEHMKKPKVIIGHNVSYDRARIKEQYWLQQTGARFIDTMSLHVCVSGLTSYQRAVLKSGKDVEDESWTSLSSLNSLAEVYKLYCGGTLSKQTRDLFVQGSLNEIRDKFQEVMKYCSEDVVATSEVTKKLYPLFVERFPHPVTLAGMLELSSSYLPVNSNWNRYVNNSEQAYEDLDIEAKILLARRADQACQLLHDEKYKEDLWLWDEDWSVGELKVKKTKSREAVRLKHAASHSAAKDATEETDDPLEDKFQYLMATRESLAKVKTHLPGYPKWYTKLCTKPDSSPDWIPGPHLISTSMKITPKLLSLTWEGYPLHYTRKDGWGFLVPFTDEATDAKLPLTQLLQKCPLLVDKHSNEASSHDAMNNITNLVQDYLMRKEYYSKLRKDNTGGLYEGSGIWCATEIENCCFFLKLPHKNGPNNNVGNPLAKDFLNKFSENVLAGDTQSAEAVIAIARMLSYWRNNRARIFDQMVVWLDESSLPKELRGGGAQYGAIIPQVVVSGTLTRRAVEPTWMTASNAQSDRVGSELRAMVQAPPGYNIVGADVDSQELWIASVIGDAGRAGVHGATPFGWMTLSGNKADGTDMHSVTAKAVGISRDHAKVINYARIYGAGQNFAEQLLRQFNPEISQAEARSKATKMFALTKGKSIYTLKHELWSDFSERTYSKWRAFELAKACGKRIEDMFLKPRWEGGTESAMFNRLEEIANSAKPRTPFLEGRLSRALEPDNVSDDRYLPTRVNWVVQSGAVDFLHLMLVSMRWIMRDNARFCLSFHDEVRYLVPEKFKYQAALAMHVTNLLTRSFCSVKLGIEDLPRSVAFFSSVEVDTVLRKDSKQECKTPSNPHGLEKGYDIKNGEALGITEAVEKAGGRFRSWYEILRK